MGDAYWDAHNALADSADRQWNAALGVGVGNRLNHGDSAGAVNMLNRFGEVDAAQKLGDNDRKRKAESALWLAKGVRAAAQAGHDPGKAFDTAVQLAPSMGYDPEALKGLRGAFDADPPGFLDALDAQATKELEFVKSSDGSYKGLDRQTGREVVSYTAPIPDKYEQFDPEKEIRRIPGRPGSGTPTTDTQGNPVPPPPAPPQENPDQIIQPFLRAGARVTSGVRTPEHNAEVGGVPNSYHLASRGGVARDLVPPQGVSMGQFHAQVQAGLPHGWQAINEGNHVHIEPGPGSARPQQVAQASGAPELVRAARPKVETDDAPLSADTVKLLAGKYLNNGQLPPMGAGKTGTRNRTLILNEATAQAKALGLDANDLVAGTVTVKAASQALSKATALRSNVEASEQTVLKNGQAALALADQVGGPTRAPVINRWIQAGRKNLAGDPQVAAFHIAVNTVATEYAKVMTTATGVGGVTSDSARQDAERLLNTAQTPAQLRAVIAQMKIEMDNRSASLREMETGLRNTIHNGGQPGGLGSPPAAAAPAAAPPAAAPATVIRYDRNGRRIK